MTIRALVDWPVPESSLAICTHQLSDQHLLQASTNLSLPPPLLCLPLHPPLPVPYCSLTLLHSPLFLQSLFDYLGLIDYLGFSDGLGLFDNLGLFEQLSLFEHFAL